MDARSFFQGALDETAGIVPCITKEKFSFDTTCSEWSLKQLLNHLINEILWMPELLAGKTITEVGDSLDGDLVGDDFRVTWKKASHLASEAVKKCDLEMTVHLSYGDVSAEHYVREMASEVLIHGWDVAQSVQCTLLMKPELAEQAYRQLEPNIQGYRDGGFVADPIDVGEEADIQTKLLALVGRKGA